MKVTVNVSYKPFKSEKLNDQACEAEDFLEKRGWIVGSGTTLATGERDLSVRGELEYLDIDTIKKLLKYLKKIAYTEGYKLEYNSVKE